MCRSVELGMDVEGLMALQAILGGFLGGRPFAEHFRILWENRKLFAVNDLERRYQS